MSILQLVANGLVLGAVYALVTLGFVLVVNADRRGQFCAWRPGNAGGYAAVVFGSWIKLPLLFLLPLVAWRCLSSAWSFAASPIFLMEASTLDGVHQHPADRRHLRMPMS